jgi:multiple sugar transport system ATP-binding protein
MSRIELRNVHKRYGNVAVLHDINLTIEPGEFCVFIGPSGCGKSTLLRLIAGLEEISSGELHIDGRKVNDLPPAQRNVAMVFQSYALYPHMSVYENMAFGLRHQKLPAGEIERRVQVAAKSLHLEGLLDRKPKALSGGQRQRVAIGRAIVRNPKVFLFDEPLSNLDAALRIQTRVEIARLHRDMGSVSMVYVTHDQVEAMTLADKIVLLRPDTAAKGLPSVAQVGHPLELYHHPRNRFVAGFIGSPSMNFLQGQVLSCTAQRVRVRLAGGQEVLADAVTPQLHADEPVTVGVRPEHVLLGQGAGRGVVSHLEHLGETTQVYLQVPGQDALLLAKGGSPSLQLGDSVPFDLPSHQVHVFRADGDAVPRPAQPHDVQHGGTPARVACA